MADRFFNPKPQFFSDNNTLLPGGQLFFFDSVAITTAKDTFPTNADAKAGTNANTNPVVLGTDGRVPDIFLSGTYRVTFQNAAGIQIWEADDYNETSTASFDSWDSTFSYGLGGNNIVTGTDDNYYRSLVDNNLGNNPVTTEDSWEPFFIDNPNKNILIGGDFSTNPFQRGISFTTVATGAYTADRFIYDKVGTMVHTISQSTDSPTVTQAGVFTTHSLLLDVTTADASIATGDFVTISQSVEGYNFIPIAQRTFVFSFWVKSTITGIHCVAFRNSGSDRSFVSEYTINATDTWERKIINVTASPSAGTWDYTNGTGLKVSWTLAAGATFQTTADTWNTGNFLATSNQVNSVSSDSNNFRIALCQVEQGDYVTTFEVLDRQSILAHCSRYTRRWTNTTPAGGPIGTGIANSTTFCDITVIFVVPMRAVPTLTRSAAADFRIGDPSLQLTVDLTLGSSTEYTCNLLAEGTGFTSGNAAVLLFTAVDTDDFLQWDAEL